jgi:hypothetical protein
MTFADRVNLRAARPPEFGEQTEEVLAEFGFIADEIETVRRDKVVCRVITLETRAVDQKKPRTMPGLLAFEVPEALSISRALDR